MRIDYRRHSLEVLAAELPLPVALECKRLASSTSPEAQQQDFASALEGVLRFLGALVAAELHAAGAFDDAPMPHGPLSAGRRLDWITQGVDRLGPRSVIATWWRTKSTQRSANLLVKLRNDLMHGRGARDLDAALASFEALVAGLRAVCLVRVRHSESVSIGCRGGVQVLMGPDPRPVHRAASWTGHLARGHVQLVRATGLVDLSPFVRLNDDGVLQVLDQRSRGGDMQLLEVGSGASHKIEAPAPRAGSSATFDAAFAASLGGAKPGRHVAWLVGVLVLLAAVGAAWWAYPLGAQLFAATVSPAAGPPPTVAGAPAGSAQGATPPAPAVPIAPPDPKLAAAPLAPKLAAAPPAPKLAAAPPAPKLVAAPPAPKVEAAPPAGAVTVVPPAPAVAVPPKGLQPSPEPQPLLPSLDARIAIQLGLAAEGTAAVAVAQGSQILAAVTATRPLAPLTTRDVLRPGCTQREPTLHSMVLRKGGAMEGDGIGVVGEYVWRERADCTLQADKRWYFETPSGADRGRRSLGWTANGRLQRQGTATWGCLEFEGKSDGVARDQMWLAMEWGDPEPRGYWVTIPAQRTPQRSGVLMPAAKQLPTLLAVWPRRVVERADDCWGESTFHGCQGDYPPALATCVVGVLRALRAP